MIRPRTLVHAGHLPASGVLLEERLLGPEALRRRALALWAPGVRVFAVPGGLLVRFVQPRLLDAGAAPGHLLVQTGGALATAPLEAGELSALAPGPGTVVVVRGGEAAALPVGPEVDPSSWLELDATVLPVETLGEPPAPPPPPEDRREVRALLAIPALSREAVAFGASLRAERAGQGERAPLVVRLAAGALLAATAGVGRGLSALRAAFRGASSTRGVAGPRPVPVPVAPRPPSRLVRTLRRLRDRLAVVTRVARLTGLRQGAYLGRLLSLFERGELDEALRRALPLGGEAGDASNTSYGVPAMRDRLEIVPARRPGGGTIHFEEDLYAEMQRIYRRAFDLLDARGDHERAAFVLAELLRADEEAVSYLERHGKHRLAAELAEARGLPPGLVVRQWFLAGDVERAVAAARARGAYADAVARLERTGRTEEALALRLLWAEDLAAAGSLEAAVQVARPVPQARALVVRWVELGVAGGGAAACALLPLLLELEPDRFAEVRDRVLEVCSDRSDDGPSRRAALSRGLRGMSTTDAVRALARPLLRARVADPELGVTALTEEQALLALVADGALQADLPARPPVRRAAPTISPSVTFAEDDVGTRPALDAAVLPGGRVLVALGEAGAVLLARDGRVLARFDAPAATLVVSDTGARALALAPRGEAVRVSRLDLDARSAAPVRDLRLREFASSYDGAAWLVATDGAVALLDVLRDDLRELWRVGDLPGRPVCPVRTPQAVTFVTLAAEVEGWRYELPGLTLRERARLELVREGERCRVAGGYTSGRWFTVVEREDGLFQVRAAHASARQAHVIPGGAIVGLCGGHAPAVAVRTDEGVQVRALGGEPAATALATVLLGGARAVALRQAGSLLTLADDRGRVAVVDLVERRVTHDLRV